MRKNRLNRLNRGTVTALAAMSIHFLLSTAALAQPGRTGAEPWGWHPMWGWGMWGFGMSLLMLVFWAAVIIGIIALVRWLWVQGKGGPPIGAGKESPLDIAKRRYASGEITKEEFETLKRDLS